MIATTIHIGLQNAIKTIAVLAIESGAGTIILADSGNDVADVALWGHDDITIRAKGSQMGLPTQGPAVDGKHSAYPSVLEGVQSADYLQARDNRLPVIIHQRRCG